MFARLNRKQSTKININFQLIKTTIDGEKLVVSQQTLIINLFPKSNKQINQCFRRIIFPNSEFISYLDVAYQLINLDCLERKEKVRSEIYRMRPNFKRHLSQVYSQSVMQKINVYQYLKLKVQAKAKQYQKHKEIFPEEFSKANQQFQDSFVFKKIHSLKYVGLKVRLSQEDMLLYSTNQLKKSRIEENFLFEEDNLFSEELCKYYSCQMDEVQSYIVGENRLIQHNIRALFQQLIQLTFALTIKSNHKIVLNQIRRVQNFISESQKTKKDYSQIVKICNEEYDIHKSNNQAFLEHMGSYTQTQSIQPCIYFKNQPSLSVEKTQSSECILTVFVHGYNGNQYDLGKIKSYLSITFGFLHFYSIRGFRQSSTATIDKLSDIAASQITSHLQLHPVFKHINFIGFSLGGVIIRAMLPKISEYKDKLNLLLTIASPHLGLRQIESCMIRMGLVYMRRVAGIESIRDLNNQLNNKQTRYLTKLSEGEGLDWFKWIVLVGSFDDCYVPAYSSLVDYQGDEPMTMEMHRNLSKKMERAIRCVAKIEYKQSLSDMLTKRKAHISYLQNDSFIRYLIVKLRPMFIKD